VLNRIEHRISNPVVAGSIAPATTLSPTHRGQFCWKKPLPPNGAAECLSRNLQG
jgi:hypothetical protein